MIRKLVVVAGLVAFGMGAVAIVDPGLASVSLPAGSVVFVGIVPLMFAYRVLVRRYEQPRYRASTGDPERAAVWRPPGDDVSETASAFLASGYAPTRRSLRAVAVAVLAHYTDGTESAARGALADHTWTDDPYAIAYFAEKRTPDLPALARLRDRLRPEAAYQRHLRHAADAVAALAGVDTPSEPTLTEQWLARLGSIGANDAGERGEAESETTSSIVAPDPTSPWETGHLRGVSVVALVAGGVGALFREPAVVLAGVVGVGVAAYASASTLPEPSLAVERRIDPQDPDPGETVTVTVTVINRGGRSLPDLRLVDGVPAALPVVEGTPRHGGVLRSGDSVEFSYAIEARRGEHEFAPLAALTRDVAGTVEAVTRIDDETTVVCRPRFRPVQSIPLRRVSSSRQGTVSTAGGGEGVEFHSIREYRRGDPLRHIDWNRRARTGEFATLQFRQERTACVVCLIDARASAYVTPRPDAVHAVDRAVSAAGRTAITLLDRGSRVGLAALSPTACWVAPATGRDHRRRLQDLLIGHDAFGATPPSESVDVSEQVTTLRRRLPKNAQILLFSPLVDEHAASAAQHLDAYGYPVSIVSPDPTVTRTASQRLARAVRRLRIGRLRRDHVPVVDWQAEESLPAALARASARWPR